MSEHTSRPSRNAMPVNHALGNDLSSSIQTSMPVTAFSPDARWSAPDGFEPHRMGLLSTTCHVVYRNWRRKDLPLSWLHVVVLHRDPTILAHVGRQLDDEGYWVTLSSAPLSRRQLHRLRPDAILADLSFSFGPGRLLRQDETRNIADLGTVQIIRMSHRLGAPSYEEHADGLVQRPTGDLERLVMILKNQISPG